MQPSTNTKKLYGLLAALANQPNKLQGRDRPTDETLAAFIDNRLSKHKRAEVIEFLAHDNDTYHRWLTQTDTLAATRADESNDKHEKTTNRLKQWFNEHLNQWLDYLSPKQLGITVVCCLSLFSITLSGIFSTPTIDTIYEQHPPQPITTTRSSHTKSYTLIPTYKPTLVTAIEFGIGKRRSQNDKTPNTEESELTQQLLDRGDRSINQIKTAILLGELAILHWSYCQPANQTNPRNANQNYFEDTHAFTVDLIKQARSSDVLPLLSIELNESEPPEALACSFAREVIGVL